MDPDIIVVSKGCEDSVEVTPESSIFRQDQCQMVPLTVELTLGILGGTGVNFVEKVIPGVSHLNPIVLGGALVVRAELPGTSKVISPREWQVELDPGGQGEGGCDGKRSVRLHATLVDL